MSFRPFAGCHSGVRWGPPVITGVNASDVNVIGYACLFTLDCLVVVDSEQILETLAF